MFDHKKISALIVGRAKPDSAGKPDESLDEAEVAAEEILDAIKDRDSAALAEALKSFIYLCRDEEPADEEEEEESEEEDAEGE